MTQALTKSEMCNGINGPISFESLGVGNTPLIDLSHLVERGQLFLKAEFHNPFGSVKDRTAVFLLNWAYENVGPGVQVVESTSGNLGVALANIGSKLGFSPIVIVDTTVSAKQIARIRDAGATIHLVEQARPGLDMRQTRIEVASELGSQPGFVWLNQYANQVGMEAHRQTTGPEIWRDCGGKIDAVVVPTSTGGTVCGIGKFLKSQAPNITIVGVEPLGSTIFGGCYSATFLIAGAGMRGPCDVTRQNVGAIDYFAKVADPVSASFAAYLHRECEIPVGLSTGAALSIGMQIAEEEDKRVVVVSSDSSVGFYQEIFELAAANPPPRQLARREVCPMSQVDPSIYAMEEVVL